MLLVAAVRTGSFNAVRRCLHPTRLERWLWGIEPASVNETDADGWSAFLVAVDMYVTDPKMISILWLLLDAGADVDIEGPRGEVALKALCSRYTDHRCPALRRLVLAVLDNSTKLEVCRQVYTELLRRWVGDPLLYAFEKEHVRWKLLIR